MPHRFMLDTNTFGVIASDRNEAVRARFRAASIEEICVSAITRGEIEFGLAKKPEATRLARTAALLFAQIDALPWTSEAAQTYGNLRASLQRAGISLGPLDMLIAAHAMTKGAVLVTSDRAFRLVPGLETEDWLAG
ncbi:type II toxin-antitoxin system VapC family toxin [Aquamicrobium sp. LC103]|uniref:type II toxin-antitoxin system VapC family toxin n=1 Tax=Aquamicrobium sp. LC103 TaxID=1120658 RepID=UPI00063E759F|nr:type II toxin-antitoxin system VapC family toxin [Aquamicrobium sp. LC103]TKT77630.1 type II toxin-antitoxin system VapC family toxin [Aquamicrobium sp. LC103]